MATPGVPSAFDIDDLGAALMSTLPAAAEDSTAGAEPADAGPSCGRPLEGGPGGCNARAVAEMAREMGKST